MNSVIATDSGCLAVGLAWGEGLESPVDAAAVWTSSDGVSWSRIEHDEDVFGAARMTSVTAGGPGFVAVGWDGHPHGGEGNAVVWTSVDGVTWSRVPHGDAAFGQQGDFTGMKEVVAGGPGLVAVGVSWSLHDDIPGPAAVWTSVDGRDWSRVPHHEALSAGGMAGVALGGPGLVAVGGDGWGHAMVWTSEDGLTWTLVPHDDAVFASDTGMAAVAATKAGLVAVGSDEVDRSAAAWTSVDGVEWTRVPDDPTTFGGHPHARITSVIAGGPGWIAVGTDGKESGSGWEDLEPMFWVAAAYD